MDIGAKDLRHFKYRGYWSGVDSTIFPNRGKMITFWD